MVLADLVNVGAGVYKGYLNGTGQDVDPTYLAFVLAGTSIFEGTSHGLKVRKKQKDPIRAAFNSSLDNPIMEGYKVTGVAAIVGAVEIAVGYGVGWVASKIVN